MTPEQEADLRRGGVSATISETRDLLAEIDRLRALPVLRTCGPCRYLVSNPTRVGLYCDNTQRPLEGDDEGRPIAPPSWCPYRGSR